MLGTIIRDLYGKQETHEIKYALDDIASPNDTYGFSSVGVYCYFNPEDSTALYIGLARDLTQRFCHHNGVIKVKPESCKVREITAWFTEHEKLGLAIFVQSPLEQVSTSRNAKKRSKNTGEHSDSPLEGLLHATTMEGILIESYKAKHGSLPPWNKTGASLTGQGLATTGGYNLLEIMTGKVDSLILSRKTLRELSDDPTYLEFESLLHGGRTYATAQHAGRGMDSRAILSAMNEITASPFLADMHTQATWKRMLDTQYLFLQSPAPATEETPGRLRLKGKR